jgi:peptidyl-Asp metalloendopeptidase
MHQLNSKLRVFSQALRSLAVGGLLLLAAGASVFAQSGSPLWQRKQAPEAIKKDKEVRKAIAVQVDVLRLRSTDNNRFSLLMPDGRLLNVLKSREKRTPKGLVWHGKIVNEPTSFVSFSVINETVAGSILTGKGQSFRLRRDPGGEQVIEEVDLKQLPDEDDSTPVPGRRGDKANDPTQDTCTTDGPDTIDVMVVYTEAARVAAGGKDAIEADIDIAVEQTNQAYVNSQINQRLRLVHVAEVSYVETGNVTTDRDRLKGKGDGFMDDVHALRDRHGADVVALIVENIGKCGKAFVMSSVGNAFEESAFAVVKRSCATAAGRYSFPHELGHLMSARHDWGADSTNNAPFTYNHGHVQVKPTRPGVAPWRTIMAYESGCPARGCPRVLNFSNPDVSVGGDPTGEATGARKKDNHRALNETALTVANFRCSVDTRH